MRVAKEVFLKPIFGFRGRPLFLVRRQEVWIDDLETGKGHLSLEFSDICVFLFQFARNPNKDGQQLLVVQRFVFDRGMPMRCTDHGRNGMKRLDPPCSVQTKHDGTQTGTFEALGYNHFLIEDIRHHLAPERRACKPTGGLNGGRLPQSVLPWRAVPYIG